MRRRILFATLLAGAVSTTVGAVPAEAHEGHASCQTFGQTVAGNAQSDQPWGQVVSMGAQAGFNSALVAEAHTIEGLCEPR